MVNQEYRTRKNGTKSNRTEGKSKLAQENIQTLIMYMHNPLMTRQAQVGRSYRYDSTNNAPARLSLIVLHCHQITNRTAW